MWLYNSGVVSGCQHHRRFSKIADFCRLTKIIFKLEMWANAQRDGRHATTMPACEND